MQISDKLILMSANGEIAPMSSKDAMEIEAAPPTADPVCCGRPVHVGSPEAYTLECCEKFIDPTPALAAKALADEIKKLEVSYHVGECIGLADWAAFEAGIAKGLEAAAEKVSARSAQVQDVAESDLAYKEARQLAVSLHAQHYSDVKQWKPLDDLRGVISQIDNMTCGLVAKHDVAAGWTMVAPSYHRDPYHVEKIMGVRWHLIFKNPNGSSRTISTHDTAEQAMAAAPAKQEGGTNE